MREMKNSGVEWIGEIPKEWEMVRGKFLYQKMQRSVNEQDEIVTCFRDGMVTLRKNRRIIGFTEALKEIGYQGIKKGDLVIHVMDAFAGAIGVSDSDGKCTPVYNVCQAKSLLNNYYYAYLLRTMAKTNYIQSLYRGIRERSSDFRFEIFANQFYPVPHIEEQTAIVSYLDKKCSNIDAIITKNEQIIEKLKEYKSSLITETVTKGLNPDVKMKNSGVEWIGEIPAEWSYGRIKYNYYLKGRIGWQGLKASEFIDDGPYLVTGTDFINGEINWESCYHISEERYNEAPEIHVKVGDLLITKDGTVGKVAFIKTKPDKVSLNSHLLIMRSLNNSYSNRFLFWIIQSNVFELYFQLTQSGSIMASLSQEKINNFSFPLPPLSEQTAIAAYLDKKCSIIDSNIAKRELINTKLTEYKKSLIYEVVTGKKEII